MTMKYIRQIAAGLVLAIVLTSCGVSKELIYGSALSDTEEAADPSAVVDSLTFTRISNTEINLMWKSVKNRNIGSYLVMRRVPDDDTWENIGEVVSESSSGTLSYVDVYDTADIIQYEYRIDTVMDGETTEGEPIYASNLLLCLDPGHYSNINSVVAEDSDDATYSEGDFMLEVGLLLRTALKQQCGISVNMTRDTGDITLGGYTNATLDYPNIKLRGKYAEDCRMFISLHTNANADDANGYATLQQPVNITKTLVIINQTAVNDETAFKVANALGKALSQVNYDLGISTSPDFTEVSGEDSLTEIDGIFNDALDTPGSVCYHYYHGHDYYGVLRGATSVNVSGMIVEHGYHTVREMRLLAADGTLAEAWSQADAAAIAEGFGFAIRQVQDTEGQDADSQNADSQDTDSSSEVEEK